MSGRASFAVHRSSFVARRSPCDAMRCNAMRCVGDGASAQRMSDRVDVGIAAGRRVAHDIIRGMRSRRAITSKRVRDR
ncbi:hypothetical protein WG70_05535 [Burkholderia oklahomensis EO147]|nr:hypothetical protein WG70_05535 [Burkholderia oklahomensis EO147]KUY60950.1 hypothetical protein WG70_06155 [Burkholderia oklahomensis EO147]